MWVAGATAMLGVSSQYFHCDECLRAFQFMVISDNPNHWSKPGDKPMYCPCCGGFDCLAAGFKITTIMGITGLVE
jgi:hypothetical protein